MMLPSDERFGGFGGVEGLDVMEGDGVPFFKSDLFDDRVAWPDGTCRMQAWWPSNFEALRTSWWYGRLLSLVDYGCHFVGGRY